MDSSTAADKKQSDSNSKNIWVKSETVCWLIGLESQIYQCHGKGTILSQPSVCVVVFTAFSYPYRVARGAWMVCRWGKGMVGWVKEDESIQ